MKTLIKDLEKIARKEGYRVRAEEVGNPIACHNSKTDTTEKVVTVYYQNDFERLAVTAHEVGHVKTTGKFYSKRQLHYERIASHWALKFLDRAGVSGSLLAEAKKFYAECLKSYK